MPELRVLKEDKRIQYLRSKDDRIRWLIDVIGEISYYKTDDYFAFLVDEIVGQMLSNTVARSMRVKLHERCDNHVSPDSILNLSEEAFRSIGLSKSKVQYIRNLAVLRKNGKVDLEGLELLSDDEVIKCLIGIKGIGQWTAKMFLLFALDRADVLPYEDKAFLQSYKWLYNTTDVHPLKVKQNCDKWSPYTSLAVRYMYRALDGGYTKTVVYEERNE